MRPRRVVLDTNIVLMPITRPGSNDSGLVQEWQTGNIIPLTSEETETELIDKLSEPRFGLDEEQVNNIAAIYLDYCVRVDIPEPPPDTPKCNDPSDQKFLILAYHVRADALVSNDNQVLALKPESEIPILNLSEFTRAILHT